jgi:ribonuclease HII
MSYIIGVDEAGRGPLAGAVFASAVLYDLNNEPVFIGLNDSKKLTEKKRHALFEEIKVKALYSSIQSSSVIEIDKINILQATLLAMKRAIENVIDYVLKHLNSPLHDIKKIYIDGNQAPKLCSQYNSISIETVIQGDALIPIISAASILAKVSRDREMQALSLLYPNYFFEKHKGYGTKMHLQALNEHGPCEIHRKSFAPVKSLLHLLPEEIGK